MTRLRVTCGCGWKTTTVQTAAFDNEAVLDAAEEHTRETGHICHIFGETEPLASPDAVQLTRDEVVATKPRVRVL